MDEQINKKSSKEFLENHFNYVDSITIVDKTGKVVAQERYNPRFTEEENRKENAWAINKSILEVIPSVNRETSTLMRVLSTGEIVYAKEQEMWDRNGRKLVCTNINFPIISRGNIIGAIELSKDITHIDKKDKLERKNFFHNLQSNSIDNKKSTEHTLDDIIAVNQEMKELKNKIKKIANSNSSVLIYGETGTGKELFVQSIHNCSYRKFKPFIPVNCAALPENLLEGLLFGSHKGAFTGAENKKGLFEEADKGTIYLDEINSMPKNLQAKLLRTLEDKKVMRLGGNSPKKIDVRVIASMNQEPSQVIKKQIREDLYYRLNVISIRIPPLRERKDAIPVLVEHFVEKYNNLLDKNIKGISLDVMNVFTSYDWPGNVRELEHIIEAAINIIEDEIIMLKHLPVYLNENNRSIKNNIDPLTLDEIKPLNKTLERVEKQLICNAINKTNGNVSKASDLLEIPRTTLQYKIDKYNLKC